MNEDNSYPYHQRTRQRPLRSLRQQRQQQHQHGLGQQGPQGNKFSEAHRHQRQYQQQQQQQQQLQNIGSQGGAQASTMGTQVINPQISYNALLGDTAFMQNLFPDTGMDGTLYREDDANLQYANSNTEHVTLPGGGLRDVNVAGDGPESIDDGTREANLEALVKDEHDRRGGALSIDTNPAFANLDGNAFAASNSSSLYNKWENLNHPSPVSNENVHQHQQPWPQTPGNHLPQTGRFDNRQQRRSIPIRDVQPQQNQQQYSQYSPVQPNPYWSVPNPGGQLGPQIIVTSPEAPHQANNIRRSISSLGITTTNYPPMPGPDINSTSPVSDHGRDLNSSPNTTQLVFPNFVPVNAPQHDRPSPEADNLGVSVQSPTAADQSDRRNGDPPRDADGKYLCSHPGCESLTFERKCEWNKHVDKHERPYRCQEQGCEKLRGFTYSGGLLRHQREVHQMHGGPKDLLHCPFPYCKRNTGTGFTRRENLTEHIRRVHKGHSEENLPPTFPTAEGIAQATSIDGESIATRSRQGSSPSTLIVGGYAPAMQMNPQDAGSPIKSRKRRISDAVHSGLTGTPSDPFAMDHLLAENKSLRFELDQKNERIRQLEDNVKTLLAQMAQARM